LSNLRLIYGKTKTIHLLSLIPVLSSLLRLPLIWTLGLLGLAIMRNASIAFSFTVSAYLLNKIVKIKINKKALTKTVTASATMTATILILQQISYDKNLLLLYIFPGATIYIALVRILKTPDNEDFQLLKQIVGEKAAKYAERILAHPL
jgi:O-antigen/teichoic acid export membrane protein